MKKLFLFLYFTFYIFNSAFSQNTLVKQWDYRFGGTLSESFSSLRQTIDEGFIIGGFSLSDSTGDKSQHSKIGYDYWIIKTDSFGNKQWDKAFGGNLHDYLYSLEQTADRGYIIGGFSFSGISGDKTQPVWGWPGDATDYWIVKLDSLGNKQWDKDFGGTYDDKLYSLQQTADGGYILGGHSLSGISGNKTQTTWGDEDFWIVKTDSLGNKQWDKDFGGARHDYLYSIQQTADGGYILGGSSFSEAYGDKSQSTWGGINDPDYWIVKTDSVGIKQWDKDFGGTNKDHLFSVKQTSDGGYILGGVSQSGISGDKTQNTMGGYDYWIVKIDSLGNKQWDKDFGGVDDEDELGSISLTADGGFLISGSSSSNISGDKTENNLGPHQTWIVKTDSQGIKQWDKTLHTYGYDENGFAIESREGCYIMANYTGAGIGGDKTQPSWGSYDYWIIKFCDSTLTTSSPTPTLPEGEGVAIAPNPASDEFTISSGQLTITKIEIFNLLGERVYHQQLPTSDLRLPTSDFPNGLYIIKAYTDKGVFQQKLVINH